MKTRLLIIFVVITSLFIGLPHSDAFFEGGMVIEVPGQIMDISDNVISPGQTMFVNGTFNQPVDDFTANIFKDYEYSSKLVLTLSPASNEFGAFNFNFTIPQDWELGNYHIALENGLQHMAWEFAVRNNYAGGSLDDSVYPAPWMIDSPLKQIKAGVHLEDIKCKESLALVTKHDGSPACVKPETVSKLVAREWGMSDNWIKISNVNKAINYQIDNAKITSIQAFSEHKNPSLQEEIKQTWLKINLESKQDGSLKIILPRNLIDSKIGHADDGFFVLLDGTETEYQETETESERILNFSIPAKTDIIEIIGYDYYNPELNQFEIIKKNINQIGYEICDIRLENDKIIIHLNWIFEGSPQEEKIISKIPSNVDYQIVYHKGYSDYFINAITAQECDSLDTTKSLMKKYDAVVEGTIKWCIGHKTHPVRYQCDIQVDQYIEFDGERTGKLAILSDRYPLISGKQNAFFGLNYDADKNYYELVETSIVANYNDFIETGRPLENEN